MRLCSLGIAWAFLCGVAACSNSSDNGGASGGAGVAVMDGGGGKNGATGGASGTGGTAVVDGGSGGASAEGGTREGGTGGSAAGTGGGAPDGGTGGTSLLEAGPDSNAAGHTGPANDSGSDAATACTSITNSAPQIEEVRVDGAFPTPQGGTILDGTYYLTADQLYETGQSAGPNGDLHKYTLLVSGASSGTTMNLQMIGYDADLVVDAASGTVTPVVNADGAPPTSILLTPVCPAGQQSRVNAYTASGDTLTIFAFSGGEKELKVYTRQH